MLDLERRFQALSDASRLRILGLLQERPLCVCEIKEALGLAISTVSKHLSLLKDARLVESEKRGKWVYYRWPEPPLDPRSAQLLALAKEWLPQEEQTQTDRRKLEHLKGQLNC
ncbi:MAG: hypothetical protein A2600_05360 [Candidatus Lambdaproteobacteria bacterium RIFOXYD1_FULL_56_27]|uniref:HTH arsR-type domain-containing protein n=1 Tax=Candidatus Lambdaproteobacteria bacterium RIFOXYD2_FULL_56_26 TaxID=1817773 RepID=A0A1F6GX65_9PROT|nr:MAG: hypothetical protein A2426_10570 [Candidatus Lambdaproteobacteria bacterium RIFOXYC1_FULL_56_13]OGH02728.1 MAG: hypothetical protein A2557_06275 [Candidatus Lambdaproteobacteria bacterium RIFOXYD2_FULL_56_26]OGH07796.1 MAG: hypothetical protein A2600_05360 [Candidatus Lambdaproteobacteria bacterium RIFOXYD1_FULL_56_27]